MNQLDEHHGAAMARFAFELGVLKRMRRAGWRHVGVRDPESVAEHSLRVAQLVSLIAAVEGADPARATYLAVWHDSQETRTGASRFHRRIKDQITSSSQWTVGRRVSAPQGERAASERSREVA